MSLFPDMDPLRFLVIDDNTRSRLLVVATLARNFPGSIITEASTLEKVSAGTDLVPMDAVVGFFSDGQDARALVHLVRSRNPRIPIVIMSEADCAKEVLGAGATRFLSCEEWLLVGTVLAEVLADAPNHVSVQ